LGGADHFIIAGVGLSVTDIVHDGAGEEEVGLGDDADLFVEAVGGDGGKVEAVDEHAAGLRQIEAAEEIDDGALAAAGVADEGDGLAGEGLEADVVKDGFVFDVGEVDVL